MPGAGQVPFNPGQGVVYQPKVTIGATTIKPDPGHYTGPDNGAPGNQPNIKKLADDITKKVKEEAAKHKQPQVQACLNKWIKLIEDRLAVDVLYFSGFISDPKEAIRLGLDKTFGWIKWSWDVCMALEI